MVRRFLLGEQKESPNVFSYTQALMELLNTLHPYTLKERHNLSVAKQHLNEIKKHTRKMYEQITILEEQVKILEENNIKKGR